MKWNRNLGRFLPVVASAVLVWLGGVGQLRAQTPVCSYQVINEYPHDDEAYIQGLVYDDGEFFESTGLTFRSSLRRVELATGIVLQQVDLADVYFGEGLALWDEKLIQITWQNEVAFVWDVVTFDPIGSFTYTGQGWGLTQDGRRLIMSDGSSTLTYRDPDTFAVLGTRMVMDDGDVVDDLNELEWIRGEVFANIYTTDFIVRIDSDTGEVIARIDLAGLKDPSWVGAQVLNGIAWDDAGERLFVTGKFWPSLFEIELTDCPELHLFWDGFESGETIRWTGVAE